jgi:hypothetical protein
MVAKLTRLTHKTAIQLNLEADTCTICSPLSKLPVRKLLDISSYVHFYNICCVHIPKQYLSWTIYMMFSYVTLKIYSKIGF